MSSVSPLLQLENPQLTVQEIVEFLRSMYQKQGKTQAVIAVSGGIDSALALALLALALPPEKIFPVFLPYRDQPVTDSVAICDFLKIPVEQRQTIQIENIVDAAAKLGGAEVENQSRVQATQMEDATQFTTNSEMSILRSRRGNLMARARMMLIFDLAKAKDALVCGTENKSEHYLGYFTRFGDAASDVEPICNLYKTQVRQLGEFLKLPEIFLQKAPTAGLWPGQTDESEMGFTYEQADQVLYELIDLQKAPTEVSLENITPEVVQKVVKQVESMKFKREVPYLFLRTG